MMVKDRNPWIAGVLTFLTMGLGHLYAGQAKKGVLLYFIVQGILLAVTLPLLYFYPTPAILCLIVLFWIAISLFLIVDAVKLSKKKKYGYKLKKYNKWYAYLGCWILASFIIQPAVGSSIKAFLIQAYRIPAGSLQPTLLIGDHIFANKGFAVKQGVEIGDIIIFPYPKDRSKDYIKRVVATGGETIEIVNKKVFINGDELFEPYVVHTDERIIQKGSMSRDNFGPVTVPENALFVMGDNRDLSNDSRFWGFVEKSQVKGKANSIYWSWDRKNFKIRWNRIGKKIK